ncbi:hypothetical protein BC832DRAFT_591573 [Gaertneriomyces semiglobifer]|nr:hypothetical protein BC832DRAFT_591573 [Gaertneriomyces semiglobifer]
MPTRDPFLASSWCPSETSNEFDAGSGFIPPDGRVPLTRRGKVLHAHVYPSFMRKETSPTIVAPKDARKMQHDVWRKARDPWGWSEDGSTSRSNCWRKCFTAFKNGVALSLRMTIEPAGTTFPAQHQLTLVNTADPFSRWKFVCTPFSFRTLAARAGWDVSEEGETIFSWFHNWIKEKVDACIADENRFIAEIDFIRHERLAVLTFFEVIHGYRKTELVSLEFSAVSWSELKETIGGDFDLLRTHKDLLQISLIQALELVSRHDPGLLMVNALDYSALQIPHPEEWVQTVTDCLGDKTAEDIIRSRALRAVAQSDEENMDGIVLESVALPIAVTTNLSDLPTKSERLFLTLYHTKKDAYILTISDPSRPFVHYTSEELTEGRFDRLLSNITVVPSKPGRRKDSKARTVGFHPDQGVGGIRTVIFGDLVGGCLKESDRYRSRLELSSGHRGSLMFDHRVPPDLRWREILAVEVEETSREKIANRVKAQLVKLQDEINESLQRLNSLLKAVASRNPSLMADIAKALGPPHRFEGMQQPSDELPSGSKLQA